MMTRFWMNSGLEVDAFLFRDGQVARGPAGDVEDFDFEAARAAAPDRVGAYELSDGTLKVVWGDGETDAATFETGDACFNWNAGLFCPARPFAVDALEGTYEGGASGSSSLGYAANARTLTFTPDGRYTMSSAGGISSETAESEVSGGSSGEEAGTHSIDGTVLTLNPDGGEPNTVPAVPFGEGVEGASPEWIYFGGVMLRRRA